MQNRIENFELTKQRIIAGVSSDKIDEIIKLLDNLKQKVGTNQARIDDLEIIVQKIIDLRIEISQESFISIAKNIDELAKEYTVLLPFLMKAYKEAKQNQIQYADHENLKEQVQNSKAFTQCLRLVLIQPMLLNMADITQNFFTSEYFGKIPIISMCENDIYAATELCNIDLYLKNNMDLLKTHNDCLSALQPYALTFSYLNKENEQISTPLNNKTFFNYFIESASHNQSINIDSDLPRLIFASDDVMHMFLSDISSNQRVYGETLKNEKIILISIDKKNNFDKIIKSIIHEIQHLYNTYLVYEYNQEDYSKYFSNEAINIFIELTNSIKYDKQTEIVKDIQNILHDFLRYKQEDRNLDELSAHLTFLLFAYPDTYLREVVDLISTEIIETPEIDSKNKALLVCEAINNALFYIENTIRHLSFALIKFKANSTKEFLDIHFKNNTDLNNIRLCAKKLVDTPHETLFWDELLEECFNIEQANENIVQGIAYIDPAYSLHEQTKIGNNQMIRDLLQTSKACINEIDKHGWSPLAYAVMNNRLSTFNLLLQFGASLKWEGAIEKVKNCNLLHVAAHFGSFEFIPVLLNYGLSAVALNEKKQDPIMLCAKFMASVSQFCQEVPEINLERNESYKENMKALAHLLSYSNDQYIKSNDDSGNNFYISLMRFRKSMALLYVLHTNGVLRFNGINMPDDIFHNIALQLNDNIPNKAFKNCYKDISVLLFANKLFFNQFIMLGMQSAYNDFQMAIQNSMNPLNEIKKKFLEIIPLDTLFTNTSFNRNPLSQDELKQLSNYYSPRNLPLTARSLSAVTLAQKELRAKSNRPFFQEDKYNERRLAISKWKTKADNSEDEGLSLVLVQIFNEMGIREVDSQTYHKLSTILSKLVIKDNKTPVNYAPQLFAREVKNMYHEHSQVNKQFKII